MLLAVGLPDVSLRGGMAEIKAIEVEAQLWKITSRVDHSYDVTFKIPEYYIEQTQEMMGHLLEEVRILVEFNPQNREISGDDTQREGSVRRRKRQPRG